MHVVTWVIGELDLCVIAEAVAYLGFSQWRDESAASMPPALLSVFVYVFEMELDADGYWDWLEI